MAILAYKSGSSHCSGPSVKMGDMSSDVPEYPGFTIEQLYGYNGMASPTRMTINEFAQMAKRFREEWELAIRADSPPLEDEDNSSQSSYKSNTDDDYPESSTDVLLRRSRSTTLTVNYLVNPIRLYFKTCRVRST